MRFIVPCTGASEKMCISLQSLRVPAILPTLPTGAKYRHSAKLSLAGLRAVCSLKNQAGLNADAFKPIGLSKDIPFAVEIAVSVALLKVSVPFF